KHRIENVDERHFGDDASKQVASPIGDGTHQHATSATAMADNPFCGCVFLFDQRPASGSEIVEAIRFLFALPVQIPAPAFVRSAADMRDGINKSTIDQ